MKDKKFSIKKRIKSFVYAINGLKILIKEEHNFRIHIFVFIIVLLFGFLFKVSPLEWVSIILTSGFVFSLEIINSAIENLADFIMPDQNDHIGKIKDLSAAAVLIAAITSLITGSIIFLPKIVIPF
jgi:diacylglycerol kinase